MPHPLSIAFEVGSLVSLATIEKSENTNQDKNVIHTCKN